MATPLSTLVDLTESSSVITPDAASFHCKVISHILDDLPKKKPPQLYKPSNPDTLAYLDFSVSTTGMLAGVKVHLSYGYSLFPLCLFTDSQKVNLTRGRVCKITLDTAY